MQTHLLVGPIPIKICRRFSSSGDLFPPPSSNLFGHDLFHHRRRHRSRCHRYRRKTTVTSSSSSSSSASNTGEQNHYVVLGIPRNATQVDIKRAYRLLARKFHPDVNKDTKAGELFKNIRCSYEVLSNEASRSQYDRVLKHQENSSFYRVKSRYNSPADVEDAMKYYYSWSEKRQRSRHERFYGQYSTYPNSHFYSETYKEQEVEEETTQEEEEQQQDSFVKVVESVLLSMFLLYILGCLASLTFSTFTALLDKELDMGYKLGFVIALMLGGKGGILLALCLTLASWLCGKRSSGVVALVAVAMWVGSNLARHAPLPQGALLTLLYMSIKLQVDSS
ncbi:unnamed protein product [Cochlearia groenlandica]